MHKVLMEVKELNAISVTIDPYENSPKIEDLIPIFATILEAKSLSISGEMKIEQLNRLRQSLPTGCLSINVTLTDKLLWERLI